MSDIEKKLEESRESIKAPDIDGQQMLNIIKEKEQVTNKPKIWKRKPFIISAIASVVSVIVIVGIFIGISISNASLLDGKYKIIQVNYDDFVNSGTDEPSSAIVKRWNEKNNKEKYYSIKYKENSYSATLSFYDSTDIKYIGEKIGTGEATGYDEYEKIYHHEDVEVFNILKVNNDASIAVKFPGDDKYYSYCNYNYDFGNIGNFVDSINIKEYATFGTVYYSYIAKDGKHHTVYFDNVDKNAIIDTFFSEKNSDMALYDGKLASGTYSLGITIEAIGRCNLSIMVFPNGKVVTNLFGYGRIFDIGENGEKFLKYLNKNYKGYTYEIIR